MLQPRPETLAVFYRKGLQQLSGNIAVSQRNTQRCIPYIPKPAHIKL